MLSSGQSRTRGGDSVISSVSKIVSYNSLFDYHCISILLRHLCGRVEPLGRKHDRWITAISYHSLRTHDVLVSNSFAFRMTKKYDCNDDQRSTVWEGYDFLQSIILQPLCTLNLISGTKIMLRAVLGQPSWSRESVVLP